MKNNNGGCSPEEILASLDSTLFAFKERVRLVIQCSEKNEFVAQLQLGSTTHGLQACAANLPDALHMLSHQVADFLNEQLVAAQQPTDASQAN